MEPHSHPDAPLVMPQTLQTAATVSTDPEVQPEVNEQVSVPEISPAQLWWDETGMEVIRATRSWVQYGIVGFAVICIVIGAVEALAGR